MVTVKNCGLTQSRPSLCRMFLIYLFTWPGIKLNKACEPKWLPSRWSYFHEQFHAFSIWQSKTSNQFTVCRFILQQRQSRCSWNLIDILVSLYRSVWCSCKNLRKEYSLLRVDGKLWTPTLSQWSKKRMQVFHKLIARHHLLYCSSCTILYLDQV